MTILITCGGTGGHIYPALAIANKIDDKVIFMGTSKRMESKIIPENGYKFISIPSSRKNPIKILLSLIKSCFIIIKENPSFIISTGGYVTLPVCVAGVMLRKKIILQEQNTIPGKVNRLIGKFAYKIALGFSMEKEYFLENKCTITGNPVRQEFVETSQTQENKKIELLIIGGSQGSRNINQAVLDYFSVSKSDIEITLLSGEKLYTECKEKITLPEKNKIIFSTKNQLKAVNAYGTEINIYPYRKDIAKLMKKANLILARSGASTLSELAAMKKAAILVPYPYAADNHQLHNAELYKQNNAAFIITDNELSAESINAIITRLQNEPDLLKKTAENAGSFYHKDAAAEIANWTKE